MSEVYVTLDAWSEEQLSAYNDMCEDLYYRELERQAAQKAQDEEERCLREEEFDEAKAEEDYWDAYSASIDPPTPSFSSPNLEPFSPRKGYWTIFDNGRARGGNSKRKTQSKLRKGFTELSALSRNYLPRPLGSNPIWQQAHLPPLYRYFSYNNFQDMNQP